MRSAVGCASTVSCQIVSEHGTGQKMLAGIVVEVRDVKGMLRQITKCMDGLDVNIVDLKISGEGRIKQDAFTLQVDDPGHLQEVIRQLKQHT